jgi:hypothetical protein
MRAAPGPADDCEFFQLVLIGDCLDICGHIRYPAASQPVGTPVTRPVECDQPDAEPVQQLPARVRAKPAPRSAVQQEDGNAIRIAEHLDREPPLTPSRPYRVRQCVPSPESAPPAGHEGRKSQHRAAGAASEGMLSWPCRVSSYPARGCPTDGADEKAGAASYSAASYSPAGYSAAAGSGAPSGMAR